MRFGRAKIDEFRIERSGDMKKELRHHTFIFFGMSWVVVCFLLLFAGMGIAGASVTYDPGINTIFLESGTNTLVSIYNEINEPSVLSYDSGTNTYTLSASISGRDGDLVLESATLVINSASADEAQIITRADLTIRDMTIKAGSSSYTWKIWGSSRLGAGYSVTILDSDVSGGHIYVCPNGYEDPTTPTVIKNNYFHDYTSTNGDEGMLTLRYNAPINAYIYNNIFENIHLTGGQYNGILSLNSYSGCVVDKIYFYDCSVNSYGVIYFAGPATYDNPAAITNFEIKDCTSGILGKEFGSVSYTKGVIENVDARALNTYQSYAGSRVSISDVSIYGAYVGLCHLSPKTELNLYDVKISGTTIGIQFNEDVSPAYLTNSLITDSSYKDYWFLYDGEAREYQLADIYVTDENGNPVESATVTIEAVAPDVSDPCINRKLESITQTVTLSSGHTPLPKEDESKTVALLSCLVTRSTDKTYTYHITAEKDGHTATVTVNPDESWYREDPNTYQNTITISIKPEEQAGDLIGYWKFDEGEGGTAFDSSGNSNDGTIHGATWVDGKIGKALEFDGSGDYVGAKSFDNINAMTIEMWIYAEDLADGSEHLAGNYDNDDDDSGFALYWYNNKLEFAINDGSNKQASVPFTETKSWTHVAGVAPGAGNGAVKIYVNGVETTGKSQTGTITNSLDNLIVGANADGASRYFEGKIDEVRVYNKALSAAEIREEYEAGSLSHPPVADPKGPYTGTEGVAIGYDGSGSYDTEGGIVAYEWDFGDGDTTSEVNPTHTYAQNGTYTVTLTVTDNDDATNTRTTTATIADSEPIADFSASPTSGIRQLTVDFTDNSASYDGIEAWKWDFDNDGVTDSAEQNPTHVYAEEGVYTVGLTVTESDGDSDTMTSVDYITVTALATLVAEWKFDEGEGGTALDSSGNGNDGTIHGATWVDGKIGKALEFDGSGDYVGAMSFDNINAMTIEMWIYAEDLADGSEHLAGNYDNDDDDSGFALYWYNNKLEFAINDGSNKQASVPFTETKSWTHVAGVAPGAGNGAVKIYVNGVETTGKSQTGTITNSLDNLIIGANADCSSRYFEGKIDEVRVYNKALSAAEIREEYEAGSLSHPPVADPKGPYTGTEGVAIGYDGSGSYDTEGGIVAYEWDFGDGDTTSEVNPTHTYAQNGTYTVTLTVTDNDDATNTRTTTATIADSEPIADFSASPTSGIRQLTVDFTDNSASYDGIEAWKWDFDNDGETDSAEQNPTHVYAEEGVYTVGLTVTESDGDSDTMTSVDYITVTALATLVAEWHFDEGEGGTAGDSSGNSNDGTIHGATWVDGKIGKALEFDGSGDYVGAMSFDNINAMTIEMWIYAEDLADGSEHLAGNYDNDDNDSGFALYWYNNKLEFAINDGSNKQASVPFTETKSWTHVAGVAPGAGNGAVKIYVNGVETTGKSQTGTITNSLDNLIIGANADCSSRYFEGKIDEVRVYNKALSAAEIREEYEAGSLSHPPVADPKGPYTGTEGVAIGYDGSGSYDTEGGIVAYEWDFGDGDTTSEVNPTHTYAQNGTYTVTLTVTDNDDATNTRTTTATIADSEPIADFSASPTSGIRQLTVDFTDNSASYDGIEAWKWDFDNDGETDSAEQNPTHVYAEEGVYTVGLTVTESDGDSDTMTSVDYITVTALATLVAEWKFDEGEGGTALDSSGNGNDGTIHGATWVDGKIGKALEFDGSGDYVGAMSFDNINAMTIEMWIYAEDLADGSEHLAGNYDNDDDDSGFALYWYNNKLEFAINDGSNKQASVPFTETKSWTHVAGVAPGAGNGAVKIYVNGVETTGKSQTGTITNSLDNLIIGANADCSSRYFEGKIDEVRVYNKALSAAEIREEYEAGSLSHPPVADPKGPYTGTEGVAIGYDGSGSYDTEGGIVAYEWDFGDGDTTSEVNPTHTYAQNGTYTVTLTVTDNDDATNTRTTTATIADSEPIADFSASPTSGIRQLTVDFTDNSASYDGIEAWKWDFDNDGVTDSAEQNPTHVYAEEGVYTVGLTVTESDGDSDTMTSVDYITVTALATLVAEWKFDEGEGGTAGDSSGNSNDGTIHGATWVDGKIGKALEFDGSGDYVGAMSFDNMNAMTIEMWIYAEDLADGTEHLAGNYNNDDNDRGFALYWYNNVLEFAINDGSIKQASVPFTETKSWTHVAGVAPGAGNGAVKIYVNGVETTGKSQTGTITNSLDNLIIGANADCSSRYFEGKIDEVRVYNKALSAAEIREGYHQ